MGWKNWPYWLKGGIIAIPISIILIPISFIIARFLGAGENINEGSYYKDSCYSKFKMCDKIQNKEIKQDCLT